ncbi:hypothetical protein BH23BAC1_BH23BAC1_13440 [soil metagenome]
MNNPWTNITGNLNYKYEFNGQGHELTVDADYSTYDRESVNNLRTIYRDANDQVAQPTEDIRNLMPSVIDIYAVKADYVLPIKNGRKFEAGIKSSYIQSDNNLVFESFLDNRWNYDETRSNHFKYSENINAAYVNFGGKLNDKTTIQMGLRVEQTSSEGNSVTLNQVVKREYTNLFPTFFLSRQIDSSNVLNISYSRRIDRPNYQSLNPFIFYLDPYTYQQGNPYLQPQMTHSLQLVHTYKNTFSTTLGYSHTTDVIIHEVPGQIPEENITYVQAQNMANQDNVNLTLSYPVKVKNWWNIQNYFTLFYNHLTSPYLGSAEKV